MDENTQTTSQTPRKRYVRLAIIIAVVIIIGALIYSGRGLFLAATVNGAPVARMTVLRELEKQSGSQALDGLITKKLIEAELKKKGIVVTDADIAVGVKEVETQLQSQGGITLKDALTAQHMTQKDLDDQIRLQKGVEKYFASSTVVTDAEVTTYIKDNKVTIPKGEEDAMKTQIKKDLEQQKLSEQAQQWVSDIKAKASIHYFGNYAALPAAPTQ